MHLVAAIDAMTDVLGQVDAPRRQLNGVRIWRINVAAATGAARQLRYSGPGLQIVDQPLLPLTGRWTRPRQVRFLYGDATHRAWRDLTKTICEALDTQGFAAADTRADALQRAQAALQRRRPDLAKGWLARAAAAGAWATAASSASLSGRYLITREDSIMRPVGAVIAAVGPRNVAKDKHYHQKASH